MNKLPMEIGHIGIPPIKCQGIKTKLVRFILANIQWDGKGRWVEPFLGSGVLAFNLAPDSAVLTDTNRHIIALYQAIQRGEITGEIVRSFLTIEGKELSNTSDYYYIVRERFNQTGSPLDFLFLNRSCFNGVMRFNRKGQFNVPFCKKPDRFSQAYVTKIANQVDWVRRQMHGRKWEFRTCDWRETLADLQPGDFVYVDPPYIGRHTDYFNAWDDAEAVALAGQVQSLPCGFALSMWLENRHRRNEHMDLHWAATEIRTIEHFYHVGSSEDLRNSMNEALAIRNGYAAPGHSNYGAYRKNGRAKGNNGLRPLEKSYDHRTQ